MNQIAPDSAALIRSVLRRTYTTELLRQEMIYAAAEMDYVLSLYAN